MKERITYIDAMRGLAMMLVVTAHCCWASFDYSPILNQLIDGELQLPLFFMISGFFASTLSGRGFLKGLADKFLLLVVPALLMLALFCLVNDRSFIEALHAKYKLGYWFTFALWGFMLIWSIVDRIVKDMNLDRHRAIIHCAAAIAVAYCGMMSERFAVSAAIGSAHYFLYPFFVMGDLLFRHRERLFKALNNNYIMGGVILLWIIGETVQFKYGLGMLGYAAGLAVLSIKGSGILIIWTLFHRLPVLSRDSGAGRFLTLVGRRSLDVYFIHYFMLPANLAVVGTFFSESADAQFVAYLLAWALAIPLTFASLAAGEILRQSPLTARWLLGVATPAKKPRAATKI